ncbi:hypothetical protein LOTGIDRAFT_156560 [Lottia gigantea]|uniref:Cadherin domain-containing protein n=1 Tax=Lottia gigantea TaxID=225164 RepID=V4BDW4_LOTGI|nr:hypothetical protein LOTGIDRAFT_156560 [Lottia gigantea]ESP03957.1 hypothetical protein LOTGIDRAFT_156560 [Lottia gigantea]
MKHAYAQAASDASQKVARTRFLGCGPLTGTIIMKIPRVNGEMWSFKEDGPKGYIELKYNGQFVIFYFQKSPDLEEINPFNTKDRIKEALPFTLECKYKGWKHVYKQAVVLIDVNDNDPEFNTKIPLKTRIPEVTATGSIIFNLRHLAIDRDIRGSVVGYSVHRLTNQTMTANDGFEYFDISNEGHNVILKKKLDFDSMETPYFFLNISAIDNGHPVGRRTYTALQLIVDDVDDLGPVFVYEDCPIVEGYCSTPVYETAVTTAYRGALKIWPGEVKAIDKDKLNYTIIYEIIKVEPVEYKDHFTIDKKTGQIRLNEAIERLNIDMIVVGIKVTEDSISHRSLTTNLRVKVTSRYTRMFGNGGGYRDVPINDFYGIEQGEKVSTSIPFSIFMSTVGLLLVVIGVLLIVFVKYFKEKPNTVTIPQTTGIYTTQPTRPLPPPPPPRRITTDLAPSTNLEPDLTHVGNFSTREEDGGSSSTSGSSLDLGFDDAISFAVSKCRNSNVTSFPFSANHFTSFNPTSVPPPEENAGQVLKRKLHNIFSSHSEVESNTKNTTGRVRFDIRNISSFS